MIFFLDEMRHPRNRRKTPLHGFRMKLKGSGKKCERRALQLLGEERGEGEFQGVLKRSAAVHAKGKGGHHQRGLGDQMTREAVVTGCVIAGPVFVMLRGGFLPVASFLFAGGHQHCGIFMLVQAKSHRLASVALQGQPYEHESKQQAGEENFHESG
jgi:hypothetical protein